MLVNYHTHTTFCDGKDEPEAIVAYAIENGIDGVGFSAHGYTSYDYSYCLRDLEGYIAEINRLKEKYAGKIAVWLGVEEDSRSLMPRERFDYIIGSCHYFFLDGKCYPIDSAHDYFTRCQGVLRAFLRVYPCAETGYRRAFRFDYEIRRVGRRGPLFARRKIFIARRTVSCECGGKRAYFRGEYGRGMPWVQNDPVPARTAFVRVEKGGRASDGFLGQPRKRNALLRL